MIDAWIDTEKMPHLPKCICGGCAVIHRGKTGCFIGCERAGDPDPSVRHVCSTAVFTDEALAGEEWNYLCDMESQEGYMKPKSDWSVREALDFANTLANHGWAREANADVASSCIYALCRMLKERGNSAAMREALRKITELFRDIDLTIDSPENEAYSIAASAIAAPPRNCDMGTEKEQTDGFLRFCRVAKPEVATCDGCPLDGTKAALCEFAWLQMPYEAKEGGDE